MAESKEGEAVTAWPAYGGLPFSSFFEDDEVEEDASLLSLIIVSSHTDQ